MPAQKPEIPTMRIKKYTLTCLKDKNVSFHNKQLPNKI